MIRYIEHVDTQGAPKTDIKPVERLLKVFTAGDTSGENITRNLMDCLKSFDLDPNNIVGQSMDGAGNMRGKHKGVKTLIQKDFPKAFYVWCCSHRFALVVEKSLEMCPQMKNLFSFLEECYVFMSGHKRQRKFLDNLEKGPKGNRQKRLKRVHTTRWSSRNDALQTVVTCFDTIKETFTELSIDKKSDSETKASATGLLKKMLDFDIISTMHIALTIFKILSPVTICLQSKSIDYSIAPKLISNTQQKLANLRSEGGWEQVKEAITVFADKHDVYQPNRRTIKRKRFMDEVAVDEHIQDPLKKIKVDVFFQVLDSLQSQLTDRFPEKSLALVTQMALFSHEGIISLAKTQETGASCKSLCIQDLCDFYEIDNEQLSDELETFLMIYKATYSSIVLSDTFPEENYEKIQDQEYDSDGEDEGNCDLENSPDLTVKGVNQWLARGFLRPYRCLLRLSGLPNLTMLYTILLSLPVTSCSAERTMSRLKIVKNRLRSSLGDQWLSSLLVLSCESDILKAITNEDIINIFAQSSEQRKKLLCRKSFSN